MNSCLTHVQNTKSSSKHTIVWDSQLSGTSAAAQPRTTNQEQRTLASILRASNIAELDGSNNYIRTVTRGLDLSGTMQSAGGIGGILATTTSSLTGNYYYDGNGNVVDILDGNDAVIAHYEYDAFGNKVAQSGSYSSQPFQWSTKEFDAESGLVYYLYRFYNPALGRWINRDPIEESGGVNLYGFVGNNGINNWDYLGQDFFKDYADWWIASHIDNPSFFVSWILGTLPETNTYDKSSTGAPGRLWKSLKNSGGYNSMLDEYKSKKCPDSDSGGYGHFASYAANYKIFILQFNAANLQVGGFYWEAKKTSETEVEFTVYNSANVGSLSGLNTLMDTLGLSKSWIPTNGVRIPGTDRRPAREVKQQFLYKETCPCSKK